ncbi:MAG: metal-dependent hydrolase [Planctomycetales bacterium]|nr:metal-dependent hydrolase [Planctomycetales bacterium]
MATQLTWYGHATWLVESGCQRIVVDPFFDCNPSSPAKAKQISADFVLVTHGHFDHIADAAEIANRCGATVVSNFEICEWFSKKHGVKQTQPMNLGGMIDLPFGRVKSTIAHHSSELPDGSYGGNPGGFLLMLRETGQRIYFAGDTALFLDMQLIGAGGLDLAVLPIGDRFTMGPDDSIAAIELLKPKRVAPSHYNTWPPIAQNATAWAARVRSKTKSVPIVLEPGGTFAI